MSTTKCPKCGNKLYVIEVAADFMLGEVPFNKINGFFTFDQGHIWEFQLVRVQCEDCLATYDLDEDLKIEDA